MARPDEVRDPTDPEDDMQRRVRYQATRAVMLALSLLDEEAQSDEAFCEHYEDVLIKKRNSRFIGEQVKTKRDESGPLKSIDEEVTKSIRRFASLKRRHGDFFDGYVLGSNAGFWDEDKTTSSLPHLLNITSEAADGSAPKKMVDYLKKLFPKPRITKKTNLQSPRGKRNWPRERRSLTIGDVDGRQVPGFRRRSGNSRWPPIR